MTKKNYVSGAAFRRWVARMCTQFDNNDNAVTWTVNGTTYAYLRSKVGKARCNPSDKWDDEIGIAYAWARCTGQQEYYNIEDTYNPVAGDRVKVRFINDRFYLWTFIAEGVDNYCFKREDGHLECYYKDRIKNITKAE